MSRDAPPEFGWSFAGARDFRLRSSLQATPLERLRDLEAMIDFNATVEAHNPRVRRVAEALAARDTDTAQPASRSEASTDAPPSTGTPVR